jgi:predicted nucleic acid-binding protein
MTLYLDTSSLIKLYIEEPGSDDVRQELGQADTGATSTVSYAEARATFVRLRREGRLTPAIFLMVKRDFDADWSKFATIEPTASLCRSAGELAERYGLRGCDSIQLATFLEVARAAAASETRFSSFDRNLNRAANAALRAVRRSGFRLRRFTASA